MISTLKNAWSIPELRKKLIFTALILLVYRVGNVIPVPYIDVNTLKDYFNSVLSNTILGLYNAMSGSAFSQATVFALGTGNVLEFKRSTRIIFPPFSTLSAGNKHTNLRPGAQRALSRQAGHRLPA